MIRSTTGGVLRTYRSNLMHSFVTLNGSRNTMLTQRNFNSYAEDPAAASRAFQMRRSLSRVEAQYAVNDSVKRKYDTAFSAIGSVQDLVKSRSNGDNAVAWDTVLRGLNDPTGDARTALGKALNQMADTVVQSMNSKYGETFIFAGADGLNVPFTWEDNKLFYRGVPVDAYVPEVVKDGGNPITIDPATGQIDPASDTYLKTLNTSEISPDEYQDAVDAKDDAQDLYDIASKVADALGKYMEDTPAQNPDGSLAMDPIQYLIDQGEITQNEVDTLKAEGLLTQDSSYVATVTIPELPTVPKVLLDENGAPVKFNSKGEIDPSATTDYHYLVIGDDADVAEVDPDSTITADDYTAAEEDVKKLNYMLNDESTFVDIGLGMKENPLNQLIESSAFDSSLQGLTYLGYGLDDEGDPKNIVSLLKEMAAICTNYVNEPWSENNAHYEEFNRLAGKLEDAMGHLDSMYTDLSAATQKLKNNGELLEENAYNLTEQISGVEDVDMAEAITSFIWAQYCYNAALKVGNSILSQSLMDYLN